MPHALPADDRLRALRSGITLTSVAIVCFSLAFVLAVLVLVLGTVKPEWLLVVGALLAFMFLLRNVSRLQKLHEARQRIDAELDRAHTPAGTQPDS